MRVGESLQFGLACVGLGFLVHQAGKYFYIGFLEFIGVGIILSGIVGFFVNLANRSAEKHEEGTDTGLWRPIYYIAMAVTFLFFGSIVMGWNFGFWGWLQ